MAVERSGMRRAITNIATCATIAAAAVFAIVITDKAYEKRLYAPLLERERELAENEARFAMKQAMPPPIVVASVPAVALVEPVEPVAVSCPVIAPPAPQIITKTVTRVVTKQAACPHAPSLFSLIFGD